MEMNLLKEKVAIITGAAQGIGKGIAIKFAQEGAKVIIADINKEKAQTTAEEINKAVNSCVAVRLDVTNESAIKKTIDQVVEDYGKIDILVNNAGIQPLKQPFYEIEGKMWDRALEVNLKSVFLCSKLIVPTFIKQGFGNIVNTASVVGPILWEGSLSYIASKAAVTQITRAMALELASYNIRVNAVAPGHVDTELNKDTFSVPGARVAMCSTVPIRRISLPKDLAGAFAFLASDKAEYITGHILYVDGGLSQNK